MLLLLLLGCVMNDCTPHAAVWRVLTLTFGLVVYMWLWLWL